MLQHGNRPQTSERSDLVEGATLADCRTAERSAGILVALSKLSDLSQTY